MINFLSNFININIKRRKLKNIFQLIRFFIIIFLSNLLNKAILEMLLYILIIFVLFVLISNYNFNNN